MILNIYTNDAYYYVILIRDSREAVAQGPGRGLPPRSLIQIVGGGGSGKTLIGVISVYMHYNCVYYCDTCYRGLPPPQLDPDSRRGGFR
jgi:hypothetical protein